MTERLNLRIKMNGRKWKNAFRTNIDYNKLRNATHSFPPYSWKKKLAQTYYMNNIYNVRYDWKVQMG